MWATPLFLELALFWTYLKVDTDMLVEVSPLVKTLLSPASSSAGKTRLNVFECNCFHI